MKRLTKICALVAGTMVSGCMMEQSPNQLGFREITSEAEYRSLFANGTLLEDGTTILYSGNQWTAMRGEQTTGGGTWSWEDGQFCRQGSAGGRDLARECQRVEVSGDRVRITAPNNRIVNGRLLS